MKRLWNRFLCFIVGHDYRLAIRSDWLDEKKRQRYIIALRCHFCGRKRVHMDRITMFERVDDEIRRDFDQVSGVGDVCGKASAPPDEPV